MPRGRSSSSSQVVLWSILGGVLAVTLIVGGIFLLRSTGKPYSELPDLDFQRAMEDANGLRGNEYRAHGIVDFRKYSGGKMLVGVKSLDTSRREYAIFIVAEGVTDKNIEIDQEYVFRVEFEREGYGIVSGVELPR